MYTIDLLKGQALPARADLKMLALMTVAFSILIFAAVFMIGSYLYNQTVVMTQNRALERYEGRFQGLKAVFEERQTLGDKRKNLGSCLGEVADTLRYETQWSEFFDAINSHLPKDLIVDLIEVRVSQNRIKVEKRSDPKKKMAIAVPARSVTLSLYCRTNCDGDQMVRDFRQKILETESFTRNIKSVEITSRQPDMIDNKEVINYKLNCILKTHSL